MSGFENFANADAGGGNKPPDPGEYLVTLAGSRAGTSKAGNDYALIELRDLQSRHEWTVFYGFRSEGAASFAKGEIQKLGIDVDAVSTLEELATALAAFEGLYFDVEVVASKNPAYDASTYIRGQAQEMPVTDVPATVPAAADVEGGDDGVPF